MASADYLLTPENCAAASARWCGRTCALKRLIAHPTPPGSCGEQDTATPLMGEAMAREMQKATLLVYQGDDFHWAYQNQLARLSTPWRPSGGGF